ncbi:MAG: diguanylate cyclase [Burkholderiales bacterium]|nr:diguanylate cyclase [Burkholderiales bacterium]
MNNLSARVRIVLLVLAAMLPILALTLHNGLRERSAAEEAEREKLSLVAELTAKRPEQLLLHARQLLQAIAANSDELLRDRSSCGDYFRRMALEAEGVFRSLGVILPDGSLHCNSALPDTVKVNVGDRPYFRLALESGQFVVGEFQVGRTSGRSGINFALPVLDAERRVRAVLFAGLNLEKFIEQGQSHHDYPRRTEEGLVTTIYDSGGLVLARYPASEKYMLGKEGPNPFLMEIIGRTRGGVFTAADVEGVRRLYAVEHVGLNPDGIRPIRVVVSKPVDVIWAAADRALLHTVAGIVIVTLLVLLAAWHASEVFVLRRVHALLEVAARIRSGDYSVRSSLGGGREELSRLGEALDLMAQGLQVRDEQLKAMLQQLNEQAITDQLTGLPNRRYLWDRLEAELMRTRRRNAPLSVILFDVDFFKQFNDRWGHEAGDIVLKNIAYAIRRVVRGSDIVARHGGEEFVIVLPEAGEDIARARAEELRREISALRLTFGGEDLGTITVSIGVVSSRNPGDTAEQLVRAADHAMYEAKQAGRDRVVFGSVTSA